MMRKELRIIAAVLVLAVLGYYGWRFIFRERTESPEELARAALTAGAAQQREMAAVRLSQLGRPAREQLVRLLGESEQPEVRVACVRGLAEQWSYRSMPVLLDALDDTSPQVRAQAGKAVQHMLRIDYEFRAGDPAEKRREIVKRLRGRWESFQRLTIGREFIRQQEGEGP